ncbi:MAG TPA: diacylglycerol kinase family protein [Opitutus sp.]|nr:diacylglycerol kinase family protein [Opitutus sp.]
MNGIVIYNDQAGGPSNGSASPDPEALRAALATVGINADVHAVNGKQIQRFISDAVSRRPDVIFAGGGDGTVSAAAARLIDTGIPLGVLPMGTLNHFARDLGVPMGWQAAIDSLASAAVRAIDVAEVNGHIFINNCSLGSYAEAVRRRDALRKRKGLGKWRAMMVASWIVFKELRRLRLRIAIAGETLSLRTPFVLVSNNRYTGRVLASSLRPRLDEGRLWLYTTRAHRHGALIRLIWQTLTRRIDEADELEVHSLTEATITLAQGALAVAADGEVLDVQSPLHFRIRPAALQVLAPATRATE